MSTAATSKNLNQPAAMQTTGKPGAIQLPRPVGRCVCGRELVPGDKFVAAVRETPIGLERVDVGSECWEAFDKKDLLAYWQTVMHRAEEKKKLFVDDQVLCTLFERLADATEQAKVQFRFVLGLILLRKRMVVYESTRREGDRDVWVVRMKGKDEHLDLIDPKLNEQQVTEVSQQLGQILNEEL